MALDLADDVAIGNQRHQRVIKAERRKIAARVAPLRFLPRDVAQRGVPFGKPPAAQAVARAAVELFDERAAPTGGQARVGQTAVQVSPNRVRHEIGVVAAARTEDAVLLAVPAEPVDGVVVRLVHVLVNAEVNLDLRRVRPDRGGARRARRPLDRQCSERLDPVAAAGTAPVGLPAPLHPDVDLARAEQAGGDRRPVSRSVRPVGNAGDRVAVEHPLTRGTARDHLRKGHVAVGRERDLKGGTATARGFAREVGRKDDFDDFGKHGHTRYPLVRGSLARPRGDNGRKTPLNPFSSVVNTGRPEAGTGTACSSDGPSRQRRSGLGPQTTDEGIDIAPQSSGAVGEFVGRLEDAPRHLLRSTSAVADLDDVP